MTGVVDGLQGHAARQSPVTDDRDTLVVLSLAVPGQGHAQGRGDGGGGMACPKMIKGAFTALQVAGHAVFLPQGVEAVIAAGDQLVGIGLVAHVPAHAVPIQVQGLIKRQGQLHHPQARTQVSAAGGHGLQVLLANLPCNLLQFRDVQPVELAGVLQLANVHPKGVSWSNLRWPGRSCRVVGMDS